jgi:transcriptional regulator with XRE-family HTH domain
MGQLKPGRTAGTGDRAARLVEEQPRGEVEAGRSSRLGSYLRRLREGYGYTLRKVEERAMAMGEAIDNSQLSRFEKGKSIPSFDKLRALARVFNVPVQNFSDVLDLEEYQHLKPHEDDFAGLIKAGAAWMARGEHGRAFVTYERALECSGDREEAADARCRMATALKCLGKLYMTERELREILKQRSKLGGRTRLRTTLQLCYLYRELGDFYLASILARECLELAQLENDSLTQAGVLNTLGNINHDEGQPDKAVERYRQSIAVLERLGGHFEMQATVLTNLGGCLVTLGRFDEGMTTLREAHGRAREGGFRRVAALSLTRMAEGFMRKADGEQARETLNESDTLASRAGDCYHDILFLNSFHRWSMARGEGNDTREKIAFGRLRHLRPLLQRRFSEVEEFDRHVERTRR